MRYPLIRPDPPKPEEFSKYLEESYRQRHFTNFGPAVTALQESLKKYLGCPYAPVTVCNATLGLEIALMAAGIRDEGVILPSYTFAATAQAVERSGNSYPILADNNLDSWHLDLSNLKVSVTNMLLVHPLGLTCDLKPYQDFCDQRGLKLIIDAAAALGSEYPQSMLGKFWDYGLCHVFSLHSTKVLGTGEGGFIVSKDPDFLDTCRRLSNFGLNPNAEVTMLGTNAKMSDFQAAVGSAALVSFSEKLNRRRAIAALYNTLLNKSCIPQTLNPLLHTFPFYSFRYTKPLEPLLKVLREKEIGHRQYYRPLHTHPFYRSIIPYNLPNAETLGKEVVCIPCYDALQDEDVHYIAGCINSL